MMLRPVLWVTTLLVLVAMVTARSAGGGRKRNNQGCGEWQYGECVAKKGTCGPGKKTGTRMGANCKVKERLFRCIVPCPDGATNTGPSDLAGRSRGRDGRRKNKPVACRYERATWGECDTTTGMRTRTLTLKKGDETCERTRTETKKCKTPSAACKYQRGAWGECDTKSMQKTRTLSLKRGDATTCESSKTETKACKGGSDGCRYGRTTSSLWGECVDGHVALTLHLKKGDPAVCEPTKVKTKSCRLRSRREAPSKCRYQRGDWSACDPTNNTRARTNTLKRANPHCEATQVEVKKCKNTNGCRYDKGAWGECNSEGMQQRVDSLKAGTTDTTCPATRSIDRRCRNKQKCKYNFGTWSECIDGKRTRTKDLATGDSKCAKTREVVKPCNGNSKKGRCEFGSWGAFGDCVNGVRTKTRPVTQGGEECQRRAVRTKPCRG